jgi:hypothetical protein
LLVRAAKTAATEALGGYLVPGVQIAAGLYGAKQTADITGSMAAGKQRDTASAISGGMAGLSLGLGAGTLAGMAERIERQERRQERRQVRLFQLSALLLVRRLECWLADICRIKQR